MQKQNQIQISGKLYSDIVRGLEAVDGGFYTAINALAGSKNTDTDTYKKLCRIRGEVEKIMENLNPSVFL